MNFLAELEQATRPDIQPKEWFSSVRMELVTEDTLDRVIDECVASGLYAMDLETSGKDSRVFNGRTASRIAGVGVSPDGQVGYYIPLLHLPNEEICIPHNKFERAMMRLVESPAVAIFHNGSFDHEFLQYGVGTPLGTWDDPTKWEDTYHLAYLRDARSRELSLKSMSREILGMNMIELHELFPPEAKTYDFSTLDITWEPALWYATSDVICTWRLFQKLKAEVLEKEIPGSKGQRAVYQIEKMCTPAVRWMERCRVHIDERKVAELIQLGQTELFDCLREIYDACNASLGRNVEPAWFRLLRKTFVADDPSYSLARQMDDCKARARGLSTNSMNPEEAEMADRLDRKGHFYPIEKHVELKIDGKKEVFKDFPERYDVLSRPQLGPLFCELQIPGLRRTGKSEQIQTTQEVIDRLESDHGKKYPFLPKFKRLGELQKALGTYLVSLHADRGPDSTIKVRYKQQGTDTGRFTTPGSEDPSQDGGTKYPMHGTPATYDKSRPQCLLRVREVITARPGKVMVSIDYAGVELRIATILSREPKWMREYFRCSSCGQDFDQGDGTTTPEPPPPFCPKCGDDRIGDLHTLTAITFFGEDAVGGKQWKQQRNDAKSSNFALAYGGGPQAIERSIGCSNDEAARHHRAFNQTYSTLRSWWDYIKKYGVKYGFVETDFGRRYPLPDIQLPVTQHEVHRVLTEEYRQKIEAGERADPPDDHVVRERVALNRKWKAKAERNATNGPIQGLSADITKLAMGMIYRECKKRGWFEKVYLTITIHDELVFEIDEDILVEAIETFRDLMARNKTILNRKWPVPLTTDCEIGYDWTVPWNVNVFKAGRVRSDGVEVDSKGQPTTKRWPENLVRLFAAAYGTADAPKLQTEAPPKPSEEQAPFAPPEEALGGVQEARTPAETTTPPPTPEPVARPPGTQETAPTPDPAPATPQGPTLPPGAPHELHLRRLSCRVAQRLAEIIVECRWSGVHPLRVYGPMGEPIKYADEEIRVNPLVFDTLARIHGL